jgi:F0F1-type ATP synthase gamma subunit
MLVCVQVLYGINQRLRVEDVDSPLCEVRPVKSVLLVVLTGDRGLCGGYNNFIIKRVSRSGGSTGLRGECGGWGDARQQG